MQWTQEAADIWHSKCTNKSTSVPSLVRAKPKRLRGCSSGPCMWHLGPRSTWRFFKTETNSLVQTGLVGTGWKVWRQLPSSPGLLGALDNSILNPLVNCLRPPRLASPYRTLASWLFFLLIRSFLPTTGAVFVLNSDLSSSISKVYRLFFFVFLLWRKLDFFLCCPACVVTPRTLSAPSVAHPQLSRSTSKRE